MQKHSVMVNIMKIQVLSGIAFIALGLFAETASASDRLSMTMNTAPTVQNASYTRREIAPQPLRRVVRVEPSETPRAVRINGTYVMQSAPAPQTTTRRIVRNVEPVKLKTMPNHFVAPAQHATPVIFSRSALQSR